MGVTGIYDSNSGLIIPLSDVESGVLEGSNWYHAFNLCPHNSVSSIPYTGRPRYLMTHGNDKK